MTYRGSHLQMPPYVRWAPPFSRQAHKRPFARSTKTPSCHLLEQPKLQAFNTSWSSLLWGQALRPRFFIPGSKAPRNNNLWRWALSGSTLFGRGCCSGTEHNVGR